MKMIIFSSLLAIALSSAAQHEMHEGMTKEKRDKMMKFLPSITRTLGGSMQKFDGLNSRVEGSPQQYKQLKDYTATLGLGWMHEYKHVITNAGLNIGSSMSGDRDKKSSTIRYIGFNGDIGYDVLHNKMISFYPFAGLGFQKYQAIFYKDNSAVDFNDVLLSPAVDNSITPVKFKNGFFVYRAGLAFALKSPKMPSNSIGIQLGYTGSFQKHDWRTNDNQVLANAPEDKISQFFVSLVLTAKPWGMMR